MSHQLKGYSQYWGNDETGRVTNRDPSEGKEDSSRLGLQKNTLQLIPVRHPPSFVVAPVETVIKFIYCSTRTVFIPDGMSTYKLCE